MDSVEELNISTYGFTAYSRYVIGVKGWVEADSLKEAKAKIDAGDVDDCEHDFDGPGEPGYDLIDIWEYEE